MKFYNSYIDLGEKFFQRVLPDKVASPKLLLWNSALAGSLFISKDLQNDRELLSQYFSGNALPEGASSIALAYSGHQFGHFNPNLGDGRAHLLGELIDKNGTNLDIQLKGSGQTAFSRRGDGKCALAPALREYIMSEALYALGVPTSRCLAVVSTGEVINRGLAKPGAVVTRVAASHLRVGSFQYFAARGDTQSLKSLVDHAIKRHFSVIDKAELSEEKRILKFLELSIDKQITLIVEWLRIGFIHGVMNTDNTAISGETIDYGPCAMMGVYDDKAVFSSIDEYGRYAFGNQGKIGQWNMARLADCLLPLLIEFSDVKDSEVDKEQYALEKVESLIHQFTTKFEKSYYKMYAEKLGINKLSISDRALVDDLLALMKSQKLDYTQTFYLLTNLMAGNVKTELNKELNDWYTKWIDILKDSKITMTEAEKVMKKSNPVVIPRNHHIEALLAKCEHSILESKNAEANDVAEMVDEFIQVIQSPYQEINATKNYQDKPEDNDQYYQTFCGT